MTLSIGFVGLPNAGKSTLMNALTRANAIVGEYPFSTIEPLQGIIDVPDYRLDKIAEIIQPDDIVPANVQFIDIAGLIRGSSKGEGLGNQFLAHIRNVDAIALVLRCFGNPSISHIYETVDPIRDLEILMLELCLADLNTLQKRIEKTKLELKFNRKLQEKMDYLLSIEASLSAGIPARLGSYAAYKEGPAILQELDFLTMKPVLYVANIDETDLEIANQAVAKLHHLAEKEGTEIVTIAAKLESEIAELDSEEAKAYLAMYHLGESGLERFVRASYDLLGLITFYTFGHLGLKAWPIRKGTLAPKAAGKIHSDMEQGFIGLEVISFEQFVEAATLEIAREKGLLRVEGREYAIQDGDIVRVRFNV